MNVCVCVLPYQCSTPFQALLHGDFGADVVEQGKKERQVDFSTLE